MPDDTSSVDSAEVTADALRRRLDRISDHLNSATHGLEQLGAALGLTLHPPEQNHTTDNAE